VFQLNCVFFLGIQKNNESADNNCELCKKLIISFSIRNNWIFSCFLTKDNNKGNKSEQINAKNEEKDSEINRFKAKYEQEIKKLNEKLSQSMANEKSLKDQIKKYEQIHELSQLLNNNKRNECINCGLLAKEQYFCCLNASYCSFNCRSKDWTKGHYMRCSKK